MSRPRVKSLIRLALLALLPASCFFAYLTQPLLTHATPGTALDVDQERLVRHVTMLTVTLAPRDALHPDRLDLVAGYIRHELESAGARVADQPYPVGDRTYRNVIASFGPDSADRIVVGAHYDTAGPLPGADDNASGVAGLLELGRLLGRATLVTRVDLVAYSLEEPPYFGTPFMGSAIHARSLKENNVHLRAMISLEMIGCFSDAPASQRLPWALLRPFYPSEGNFIAVVGDVGGGFLVRRIKRAMSEATALPVCSLNAPRFAPGVNLSDQRSYWDAGYDAVMVTDTAFFRNVNYHTSADTAEKLDMRRMAQVVQGVYAAVMDLAHSPWPMNAPTTGAPLLQSPPPGGFTLEASAAAAILGQGLPLADTRVQGILKLRDIVDRPDTISSPIVIRNCVLDQLDAGFLLFQRAMVLENVEVTGACSFDSCFFPAGFSATRCRFRSGLDMRWGGNNRNGALFRLEDCEFEGFADFEDEWFEGPVMIRGCAFRGGTNLLGMKGQPFQVSFDVKPIIESNTGTMDLDGRPAGR